MTQTVLITGCSSGLGQASALLFAKRGWNVLASMRRPERASKQLSLPNVLVPRLDVQDVESVEQTINQGIECFGGIDVLVNNAGYGVAGLFEATSDRQIREQFDVNVFGVMNTIRAILPHFRSRRSGVIVNISSGSGVFAIPNASLYCASKFALEGFSEGISYEVGSQGVRMKIIEPGGIFSTEFFKRSWQESVRNYALPDYDTFVAHTKASSARLQSQLGGTEEDVAECIYTAATDGTKQLRYVATADIGFLIRARRETSESEYMTLMSVIFEKNGDVSETANRS